VAEAVRDGGHPAAGDAQAARTERRPVRLATLGISTTPTCGVRDHAALLADGLRRENVTSSMHWLQREQHGLGASRAGISRWTRGLAAELAPQRPQAILLHYSVFSYSHRGLPLFVHPTLAALRELELPIVSFLHEFAYPWRAADARGAAWALSQRALLIELMRTSAAAVATIEERAGWLTSRAWLPSRPVAFAPVFSTLPAPRPEAALQRRGSSVGLFGYSYEGAAMSLVLDALRLAHDRGSPVTLMLLGAPGRDSPAGGAWREAARARGLEEALAFSGRLSAQDLSDALTACALLLFADGPGPTSRKTTLAASLASGSPVIAVDGPRSWPELLQAGAAEVVPATPEALAAAIGALLADPPRREALAARGRDFAAGSMGVERSATVLAELLAQVLRAGG
jgi:glycosyltransferase involved in cell wall biosynthesis